MTLLHCLLIGRLHDMFALLSSYRAKKVHDGVTHAAKLFPNAYIVMIAIGAIKGNGAGFVKVGSLSFFFDISNIFLFSSTSRLVSALYGVFGPPLLWNSLSPTCKCNSFIPKTQKP